MQIFRPAKSDFLTTVAQSFPPAHITYVRLATPAAARTTIGAYRRSFARHGAANHFAAITVPAPAVVPYLSIRSNLLLNGEKVPFQVLPKAFRADREFLDGPATHLTPEQSLYVQLFRAVLGGRELITLNDFPASMDVLSVRAFLNLAAATLRQTASALVIFTHDETLLAAHPHHRFDAAPVLPDE